MKYGLAKTERAARSFATNPAEITTDHLQERGESEAVGHDGIVLEMAAEEPEVRLDVELGAHQALAEFTAGLADFGDAVEHQHRWQRQLGITRAEHLAAA